MFLIDRLDELFLGKCFFPNLIGCKTEKRLENKLISLRKYDADAQITKSEMSSQ